jgi:hypothetical protein
MEPSGHDALLYAVTIIALVYAALCVGYWLRHIRLWRARFRLAGGMFSLGIAVVSILHLIGILPHGNPQFVWAVMGLLVTLIVYIIASW